MLTVVSIFISYPFYTKKEKYYYLTAIITGIIYDAYNLAIVNCLSSILSGTGAIVGYIRYIKQTEEDKIIV